MKKRIASVLLAFLVCTALCGCDTGTTAGNEAELSASAQLFLRLVGEIGDVTLGSEADINAPLIVWEHLPEAQRSLKAVQEGKERLDACKTQFDAAVGAAEREALQKEEDARVNRFLDAVASLPAESELVLEDRETLDGVKALYDALSETSKSLERVAEAEKKFLSLGEALTRMETEAREQFVKERAEAFLSAVEALGEVTLESGEEISALLGDFESFDEDIKAYEGVAEAKAVLDEKMNTYRALRDEADIRDFCSRVEGIGDVTLASGDLIKSTLLAYDLLSDAAKENADAQAAYEKLQQKKARYDELFAIAEQERVDIFLAKVARIPDDTSGLDITWFDMLKDASDAYFALSLETQQNNGAVKAAFEKWNAAQKLFDEKGYRQIPIAAEKIDFSGDNPPYVLIHTFEHLDTTLAFYQVDSVGALSAYADGCLDVYVDGAYVAAVKIDMTKLFNRFILKEVLPLLKPLEAEYPAVKSGAKFSFTFHFEDKKGEFIPSEKTPRSGEVTYTW